MPRSAEALIKPELLAWARESAQLDLALAAQKLRITIEKLTSWESGETRPTVKQLRKLAAAYRQSFAAFYLPEAPPVFRPPMKDYRRFPGDSPPVLSFEIAFDAREALDRREITLELYSDRGETPPAFSTRATLRREPESLGEELRNLLGVAGRLERSCQDPRLAFNMWREKLEALGVMVFQSSKIDTSEMRGYSIWLDPLPIIVVNRKDAYAGRTFTLFHELTHLVLKSGAICDLHLGSGRTPADQKVEVFCNHVAGASLVPKTSLLLEPDVQKNQSTKWSDDELHSLSRLYGVSREVILRRLLILGRTTEAFYRKKRKQFSEEARVTPRRSGYVPPATDVLSRGGKLFVRLVLDALNADRITTSDASDYLGLRLKHFGRLEASVEIGR